MTVSEVGLEVRNDGKDHIRIGPDARTLLGRLLANTALTPFVHPELGAFDSMEALWAYVKSGCCREELRKLRGEQALRETHACRRVPTRHFRRLICQGLEAKIETHPQLRNLLATNRLDFVRYEVIDNEPLLNFQQAWFLNHLRKLVKEKRALWLPA